MTTFEIYLPLKESLVVIFSETCAHISRKCIFCSRYEPDKFTQKTQITLVALIQFCFRTIASKCSFLEFFLPLRELLVEEPKDKVERGMKISKA